MTKSLQILIPIAGESSFFDSTEHFFPKPLVDILGKPMIERVVAPLRVAAQNAKFIFLVQEADVSRFSIDAILRLCAGSDAVILTLGTPTHGALCTSLLAVDHLDGEAPLLISNGDQVLELDYAKLIEKFEDGDAAASVATFESIHPRWSYVLMGEDGFVAQAAEKNVISRNAIAGLYYFREAKNFISAAKASIMFGERVANGFFIAPSLNHLILQGQKVANVPIPTECYHSFYSPRKVDEYMDLCLQRANRSDANVMRRVTVVIPAAGRGSRFLAAGWRKPKPFIDVNGSSMIECVMDNAMPSRSRCIVLLHRDHISSSPFLVDRIAERATIVEVEKLTQGTLCTVLLARGEIGDDDPLLVVNSDQLIDFSVDRFVEDCFARNLDGSILVFRDEQLDPKWSFAKVDAQGYVVETAEKQPISPFATVGIYLFRRSRDFMNAAIDMFSRDDSEVDPVFGTRVLVGDRGCSVLDGADDDEENET